MADAARARYDAAVAWVRGLPTDGPIKPAQATQLRFYALFTQAAKGPAARAPGASRPGMWNVVARAKYDAWAALGDLPEDEARAAYVAELLDLLDAHRDALPADQAETDDVVELRRTLEGGAGEDDDDGDEDADLDDDDGDDGGGGGIGSGDVDANESDGEGESAAAGAGSASAAASAAGAAAAAASERRASGGNAAGPALVAQSLPLPRGSSAAAAGAAAAAVSAATPLSASVSHSRNDALAAAVRRAEAAEAALTALTARMEVLEESNARVERSVTLRVDALQERVSRLVAMVRGHLRRSSLLGVVAGIAPLLFLFLRRRRAHRRAAGGGRRHK